MPRDALRGIAERGGIAILVGGTGLYLRAVARGLDTDALPARSRPSAPRLEAELAARGPRAARRPPARRRARRSRRTVDLRNPRRVVRALEIAELAATARCRRRAATPARSRGSACASTRPTHRAWIAARARAQFDAGLIEEAPALRERFDPACRRSRRSATARPGRSLDGELDARGRDRAGRRAQRRVREAPADLVPRASRTSRGSMRRSASALPAVPRSVDGSADVRHPVRLAGPVRRLDACSQRAESAVISDQVGGTHEIGAVPRAHGTRRANP